ncbi:hypothetical protein DIPPA_22481 [Diplonema papillatum]|nr:hypothetical protein DIPPA_22481 [Diplonema papillatum]|eukprot:gene13470-20752_t
MALLPPASDSLAPPLQAVNFDCTGEEPLRLLVEPPVDAPEEAPAVVYGDDDQSNAQTNAELDHRASGHHQQHRGSNGSALPYANLTNADATITDAHPDETPAADDAAEEGEDPGSDRDQATPTPPAHGGALGLPTPYVDYVSVVSSAPGFSPAAHGAYGSEAVTGHDGSNATPPPAPGLPTPYVGYASVASSPAAAHGGAYGATVPPEAAADHSGSNPTASRQPGDPPRSHSAGLRRQPPGQSAPARPRSGLAAPRPWSVPTPRGDATPTATASSGRPPAAAGSVAAGRRGGGGVARRAESCCPRPFKGPLKDVETVLSEVLRSRSGRGNERQVSCSEGVLGVPRASRELIGGSAARGRLMAGIEAAFDGHTSLTKTQTRFASRKSLSELGLRIEVDKPITAYNTAAGAAPSRPPRLSPPNVVSTRSYILPPSAPAVAAQRSLFPPPEMPPEIQPPPREIFGQPAPPQKSLKSSLKSGEPPASPAAAVGAAARGGSAYCRMLRSYTGLLRRMQEEDRRRRPLLAASDETNETFLRHLADRAERNVHSLGVTADQVNPFAPDSPAAGGESGRDKQDALDWVFNDFVGFCDRVRRRALDANRAADAEAVDAEETKEALFRKFIAHQLVLAETGELSLPKAPARDDEARKHQGCTGRQLHAGRCSPRSEAGLDGGGGGTTGNSPVVAEGKDQGDDAGPQGCSGRPQMQGSPRSQTGPDGIPHGDEGQAPGQGPPDGGGGGRKGGGPSAGYPPDSPDGGVAKSQSPEYPGVTGGVLSPGELIGVGAACGRPGTAPLASRGYAGREGPLGPALFMHSRDKERNMQQLVSRQSALAVVAQQVGVEEQRISELEAERPHAETAARAAEIDGLIAEGSLAIDRLHERADMLSSTSQRTLRRNPHESPAARAQRWQEQAQLQGASVLGDCVQKHARGHYATLQRAQVRHQKAARILFNKASPAMRCKIIGRRRQRLAASTSDAQSACLLFMPTPQPVEAELT